MFQARLLEISDPAHPTFGQHMTAAQVAALVAPPASVVQTVTAWLTSQTSATASDVSLSGSGDFLSVVLPVHEVWASVVIDRRIVTLVCWFNSVSGR
jgi:tripeptidyl-peptidase-1